MQGTQVWSLVREVSHVAWSSQKKTEAIQTVMRALYAASQGWGDNSSPSPYGWWLEQLWIIQLLWLPEYPLRRTPVLFSVPGSEGTEVFSPPKSLGPGGSFPHPVPTKLPSSYIMACGWTTFSHLYHVPALLELPSHHTSWDQASSPPPFNANSHLEHFDLNLTQVSLSENLNFFTTT